MSDIPGTKATHAITSLLRVVGAGAAVAMAVSACAGETTSSLWTYEPGAAAETPMATPELVGSEPESSPASGQARPLQPPAGVVIPRVVEPQRAEQPDPAEAVPAPLQIDPAANTITTDEPAGSPLPTPSAEATAPASGPPVAE